MLPKRPTISLAMIIKNEAKNLPRLFASIKDCYDVIHITDTGSTDDSLRWLKEEGEKVAGCPVEIHHFDWVDDFSAARNYAFSHVKTDYVMWLDGDDALHSRENFIKWRDHAMEFVQYWLATYDYALDKDGKPQISFVRERVFRMDINPTWSYPIHEGIVPTPGWAVNYATPWKVQHHRTMEDVQADKNRNLGIFERKILKEGLDGRMNFYFGKELHEGGRYHEAIKAFDAALTLPQERHDKILTLQYASYSCTAIFDSLKNELVEEKRKWFDKALKYAHEGILLDSNRAEFYIAAGDLHVRINQLVQAIPYFGAAKHCLKQNGPYQGAIYSFEQHYGEAPSLQLAKVYAHLGLLEKSKIEALHCAETYNNEEARTVLSEVNRVSAVTKIDNNQVAVDDIVITTPPQNAYPFDEEIYKTKALGGSETALVQMARLLKEKTGRRVIVFNQRETDLIAESGVEYVSNGKLAEYFSLFKPSVHVAWRHNIKLTNAPTYLWCHDLFTPGVEGTQNFDKFLALSNFHKNYTQGLQGVSEEKIVTTRNGIDPEKFKFVRKSKDPNKLVWMSSPDRGLDKCMLIMDEVTKEFPEATLHVYYGVENLYNYGPQMTALANKLKAMMNARPFVKYHGFTEQKKMYQEVSDAVVWPHCNNFIETFCITALECLANGIYPVVRRLGALSDTLRDAESKGDAVLLDYEWSDPNSTKLHAEEICKVMREKRWEQMKPFDFEKHDWATVADEWIEITNLKALSMEKAV